MLLKSCLITILNIAKAIPKEIKQVLYSYSKETSSLNISKDQLGYYLAGLLEGDGYNSLPAMGNSTVNRVLSLVLCLLHIKNNIGLYAYLQSELGGIGRFQLSNENTVRYIIGDIEGIKLVINLVHGKLRTPK